MNQEFLKRSQKYFDKLNSLNDVKALKEVSSEIARLAKSIEADKLLKQQLKETKSNRRDLLNKIKEFEIIIKN